MKISRHSVLLMAVGLGLQGIVFGAAFEPLGYGAAAKGMAGAYVALAEDGTAAYWNPAGLALTKTPEMTASLEDLYGLGLLRYATAGYTHPRVGNGTFSAHLLHLDTQGDASFFNYAESTYLVAYGRQMFREDLSLGVGMRYYTATGDDVKGTGLGFDAGALWRPLDDRLRIGLTWQDLNRPRISWSTNHRENLPSTLRLGAAWRLTEDADVSIQRDKRTDEGAVWRFGASHNFLKDRVALRGGLHRSADTDEWSLALGGGIRYRNLNFDYAWDTTDDLGNTQTLSLGLRFGK